jgi:hypothetical protein
MICDMILLTERVKRDGLWRRLLIISVISSKRELQLFKLRFGILKVALEQVKDKLTLLKG